MYKEYERTFESIVKFTDMYSNWPLFWKIHFFKITAKTTQTPISEIHKKNVFLLS